MAGDTATSATTGQLASFLAGVRFEALPPPLVERAKELFLDWVGAALAGRGARPVRALERFADAMGPHHGPSELLVSRRRSSPLFADSKQLHTAKAAADGLLAAYVAGEGLTGAARILEGAQGMAAGMSSDADPARLTGGLGTRWAVLETSFKFHACCRHTHPAADALQQLMREHQLSAAEIARVRARVHQAAIDVLGPVTDPRTVHQSKFSMGFVLALIALRGRAGITDFTQAQLSNPEVRAFMDRVEMVLDPEVDAAYPLRWLGAVEVETRGGERYTARVDVPKGDPGNTLTRQELEDKAQRLAAFQRGASREEMRRVIERVWALERAPDVRDLLAPWSGA